MSYLESVFNSEDVVPETLEESLASAGFRNVGDIMRECMARLETPEMKTVLKVLKMTRDEACAIYAYLYEARAFEESPFRVVSKALMDRDTEKLKTLRGFVLLLLSALRKLKPEDGECLYRGIDGKWLNGDKSNFEKGKTLVFESFTSTTMDKRVATMFIDRHGVEAPVLYEIHGDYLGYLVDTFSKFSQEKEVLLEPEAEFVVEDIREEKLPKSGNSYKKVVLRATKKEPVLSAAVKTFEKKCQERAKSLPPKKDIVFGSGSDEDDGTTSAFCKHKKALEPIFSSTMEFGLSGLDTLQQMPPGFYETLDRAFEDACFKDLAEIRKWAQKKARKLEERGKLGTVGMNKEDAEVLISFTYEGGNSEDKPSYLVNKAIAERNNNSLRAYRGYILHLLSVLRRLRPIRTEGITLYRVADSRLYEGLYRVDRKLSWPGFTFTTLSEDAVYEQSLERAEQPIIFEIRGDFVGYDIQMFSGFPDEDEVLLEPGTVFSVVSIQQDTRNPRAKRVVVAVQQTPLVIEDAVENFGRAGRCNYMNNNGGLDVFNGFGQMQYMNASNNGFGQFFNQQN